MINGMTIFAMVVVFTLGLLGYRLGYRQGRSDQCQEFIAELESMKEDMINENLAEKKGDKENGTC